MKRSILLVLVICGMIAGVDASHAQFFYSLESTPGTSLSPYFPLSAAETLPMLWNDTSLTAVFFNDSTAVSLFNKPFAVAQTFPIYISCDGSFYIWSETEAVVIDAFNVTIDSLAPQASVRFKTETEGNEDVLKFEWKDVSLKGCPQSRLNFQLWLYKTTGIIEFHYGELTTTCDSSWKGPYIGTVKSNPNLRSNLKINWLKGDPAAPELTYKEFFPAMKGIPSFGTVYRLIPTSLSEVASSSTNGQLHCSPNPASDQLTVSFDTQEAEIAYIRIMDLTGKVVYTAESTASTARLNIQSLPVGMYSLEYSVNGRIEHSRFIKQ